MSSPLTRRFQTATLSFAFLLTGVATALLGASFPIILKNYHLTDTQGGCLLLLAWGGCTCGALLFRGSLRRSSATGLLITALSMLMLAILNRSVALPIFAFYGLGLGISMTAITLLSSQATSQKSRNRTMMRLNLLWSVGACIAPTLASQALTHMRIRGLFSAMGIVFCTAASTVFFGGEENKSDAATGTSRLGTAPMAFYAIAFLAVGVESALGGWLATYSSRTAHTELITISALTAFWAGLLLSRALHSLAGLSWLQEQPVLIAHAAIGALASATLLAAPFSGAFVPSALLAGFSLGPIYPRVLATVVGAYRTRAVFIVAGVGSAALPWMTGALSHAAGSLRLGLLVPCLGAFALLPLTVLQALRLKTQDI